jgi:hypothetical protein
LEFGCCHPLIDLAKTLHTTIGIDAEVQPARPASILEKLCPNAPANWLLAASGAGQCFESVACKCAAMPDIYFFMRGGADEMKQVKKTIITT